MSRRRRKDGTLSRPNRWHDHLMDIYSCAAHAWWLAMEDTTSMYATEMREYREHTPPPRLKDYMLELSLGWGGRA